MEPCRPLRIPKTGISNHSRRVVLRDQLQGLLHKKRHFAGFQTNQHTYHQPELHDFWQMNLLNLGDCWQQGFYQLHGKSFENAVLDWYANLWHCQAPWWGYITSMGSTEGNLYSLWAARDFLRKRHGQSPILLSCSNSHYSIHKAAHLLDLKTPSQHFGDTRWPEHLPTTIEGGADITHMLEIVSRLMLQNIPVIVVLTLGSTFNGHCDNWRDLADNLLQQFGPSLADRCWLHLDGALAGNYLPLSKDAAVQSLAPDFRHPLLHSVCCSPYKWLGLPFPIGVVMTKPHYQAILPDHAHYTGSLDTTVAGSRSGLACVLLWTQLSRRSVRQQQRLLQRLQLRLQWFEQQLSDVIQRQDAQGKHLRILPKSQGSLVLVFSAPTPLICRQFSLPTSTSPSRPSTELYCHIVLLEHCSKALLCRLLASLSQAGAFPSTYQD